MTTSMTRRRRSTAVVVSTIIAAAALTVGCSSDDGPDEQGVCIDPQTQQRVDDDRCDDGNGHGGHGGMWVFYSRGSTIPPVGSPATGYHAQPAKGASVARGGFGRGGGVVGG